MAKYKIVAIPIFSDNYIWCLHNNSRAIIVDPGDAGPVLAFLSAHNLELDSILITHRHNDHIGGVAELTDSFPKVQLFGCGYAKYQDNQELRLNIEDLNCMLINAPGHTDDHLLFLIDGKHLFCGDVLFSLGCGRVFTNDFMAAFESLHKIKQLSQDSLIYPAHEYTLSNLNFTLQVDSAKEYYTGFIDKTNMLLKTVGNSLPSTLADELSYNLFLRTDEVYVQKLLSGKTGRLINNAFEAFVALRNLRNNF